MPPILIAYDGSEPAKAAVAAAGRLFAGAEAKVVVVHDAPPRPGRALVAGALPNEALFESLAELDREAAERAAAIAEEGRALAADGGLAAEAATLRTTGAPWSEVLRAAADLGAAVVVSGTRGHGAVGRALLGSTSSSLLHQSEIPVLIVPVHEEVAGPVVIGYDGSDAARAAIATAAGLFPGREALVVHVWTWPLTDSFTETALRAAPGVAASEVVELVKDQAEDTARRTAEEGRALAEEHGLVARAQLVEATEGVWRGLAAAAGDVDAAALAVGSRGRGAVASALLGSASMALAHHAERPTLVIPPSD